jgi:hypothetical protein
MGNPIPGDSRPIDGGDRRGARSEHYSLDG